MQKMQLLLLTDEISHIILRWFCGCKPELSESTVTFSKYLCLSLETGFLKNYTILSLVYNTSNHSVFGLSSVVHSFKIWILGAKYRKLASFLSASERWGGAYSADPVWQLP
jgi:hypothetical protein